MKVESREGDRRRIRKNSPEEASSGLHSLSGDQTSAAAVAHKRYGVAYRVCATPSSNLGAVHRQPLNPVGRAGRGAGACQKGQAAMLAEPPFRHRTRMGAGIAGEALPAAATKPRSRRPSHRAILSFAKFLRTHHLTPSPRCSFRSAGSKTRSRRHGPLHREEGAHRSRHARAQVAWWQGPVQLRVRSQTISRGTLSRTTGEIHKRGGARPSLRFACTSLPESSPFVARMITTASLASSVEATTETT